MATGESGTTDLITKLRKEVALMRSPDVPEDVRRILKTPADLMEQAAARLDRAQLAEAAIAARRARNARRPWPTHVWSVAFVAFMLGAAGTGAAAWFLIPEEEAAPVQAKAAPAPVVPSALKAALEDAAGDPLALRLETQLAGRTPSR